MKERERMGGVIVSKFRKTPNKKEENVGTLDNSKVELDAEEERLSSAESLKKSNLPINLILILIFFLHYFDDKF